MPSCTGASSRYPSSRATASGIEGLKPSFFILAPAVSQSLIGELNRVAGAPDRTQWHFAGMSGVGKGDLAVSTHTEIGSNLTGFAVAWDGETARPLDKLQGTVTNIRDLDHGRALVCTDKGHGAYQSRTGKQLWWKRGPRCPVVFRE